MTNLKAVIVGSALCLCPVLALAQNFNHYSTTDTERWVKGKDVKASNTKASSSYSTSNSTSEPPTNFNSVITLTDKDNPIVTFRGWGTTFNEQDWKALCMLQRQEQDEILERVFSPEGEVRFGIGRISMNANDYALDWFSCSEVEGDFDLKHFNIERDKLTIIPYIRAAQKYNPDLKFWMSPWSPPAWMKINHHYAVQSNRYNDLDPKLDHLLFGDGDRSDNEQINPDKNLFPRRLAIQDYFIQDPRYLQAYANMFSRFIDLYGEQGIPISMVAYQNEAYSYTPYPGCPWTSEGILRFNLEYLSPTLKQNNPGVDILLGTFNTNRYDHVKDLLKDPRMEDNIVAIGFQWEGGQILPRIRKEYPGYRYISTESECGNGDMDWNAAEHTFHLINHYIGNGCSEYNNWNLILCDKGESPWGWRQNALIRVNSKDRSYEYVPEYYAYRHYSNFIQDGAEIIGFTPTSTNNTPVLVALTPENKYVIVAANFNDTPQQITVDLQGRTLSYTMEPHSMHTFVEK